MTLSYIRKATLGLVSIKSTQPEARPEVGKDSQLLNGFVYCINKDFLVVNNALGSLKTVLYVSGWLLNSHSRYALEVFQ